ncbi:MAG: YebC/PmpR family DNA-binding transcriptional regulator [Elusimicrobia bacterium]|nr:YebC/PmpR family DNA-binding transcriptional regulator [Elusimicrobiota bacterium]
MGGHSHWAGIKHKKAVVDAKKGKLFTRLIREITIAARLGGGSLENNPRLRKAVEEGRAANMPSENVVRAIQRGTGELPGVHLEEVTYEGYGPAGIAVLCEATTDNRNRTTSEVRRIFSQHGGNLGETGCVAWLFQLKGYISVPKKTIPEEKLLTLVLEAGAEDFRTREAEVFEVVTACSDFDGVLRKIIEAGIEPDTAEQTYLPQSQVPVGREEAPRVLALTEALEAQEDIRNVYTNFEIPDDILQSLSA